MAGKKPTANIFKNMQLEALRAGITPRTKESMTWFRQKANQVRRVNRNVLMKQDELDLTARLRPGAMAMFFYDPKHKDTLPYYDAFPLTILVDKAPNGFYGLNLHYLPPLLRAKFLDTILETATTKKYTPNTRLDITYDYLKRASKQKYFEPCFKHYLTSHMRSRFAVVPAPEWEIAAFLPTADFQKASKSKVYSDSRKML